MSTAVRSLTYIERARAAQKDQMAEVCALLGWSRFSYCQHQYEQYEAFIALLCETLPQYREILRYSPVFRGFWNNEWALRIKQEFLSFAWDCSFNTDEIEAEYLFINSAEHLLHDITFRNRFEYILKSI